MESKHVYAAAENPVHELTPDNFTYRRIASNAARAGGVRDCCRAGGTRTSCEPASCRWIYGFPVPSAGTGFAHALK